MFDFIFRKADKINFNINLLVIADTHNQLFFINKIKIPTPDKYDLCILLGDISKDDIRELLKYIPKEKMIGILGNHDDKDNLSAFGITNINSSIYIYNGISFVGLEGCIKYKKNQIGYSKEESKNICSKLPKADIFISHNIPYKFMGELNGIHIGDPAINKYLIKNKVPVNICGHNHSYKIDKLKNKTTVIETYMISMINISPGNIEIKKTFQGMS